MIFSFCCIVAVLSLKVKWPHWPLVTLPLATLANGQSSSQWSADELAALSVSSLVVQLGDSGLHQSVAS